jgi:hypothetical protein
MGHGPRRMKQKGRLAFRRCLRMVEIHVADRSPVSAYRFLEIQSLGEARGCDPSRQGMAITPQPGAREGESPPFSALIPPCGGLTKLRNC